MRRWPGRGWGRWVVDGRICGKVMLNGIGLVMWWWLEDPVFLGM